jgi:hypothetical protein
MSHEHLKAFLAAAKVGTDAQLVQAAFALVDGLLNTLDDALHLGRTGRLPPPPELPQLVAPSVHVYLMGKKMRARRMSRRKER